MHDGWLIRDGEVIASSSHLTGVRSRVVLVQHFPENVGALVVSGPAIVVGAALVRLGESSRVRALTQPYGIRIVGVGRHAIVVRPEVLARLRVGDDLHFRTQS